MKIKTITCHDVYNVGASLQAYALQKYLSSLGHDTEIIDYKPEYLSRHYSLTAINNPKYRKPVLRELYILAKLPKRIKAQKSEKKKAFDDFRHKYLKLTKRRYRSNKELQMKCPEADIYLAGSDQIWNPLFPNGRDPAFFLDFVPNGKIKASYAASFAVAEIEDEERIRIGDYLRKFNIISVRENSAFGLLEEMHLKGTHVCDPVFLISEENWRSIAVPFLEQRPYIFIYDFDGNKEIHQMLKNFADKNDLAIVSAFPFKGGRHLPGLGPLEFLGVIAKAKMVISNSFHATAFSIIFHVPFAVFNRKEAINVRMTDLTRCFGCEKSQINEKEEIVFPELDWNEIDKKRDDLIMQSKQYLDQCIAMGNEK